METKEVATVTTEEFDSYDGRYAIETDNKVIFLNNSYGNYLLYDKATKKLSIEPIPDEFKEVGMRSYNEQGVAYKYAENRTYITRYNIADMTTKRIDCDRSAVPPFIETTLQQTSIDFFEFGIKNSNGAPIRVQTTLETGKVTVHEDADDRKIAELIKIS